MIYNHSQTAPQYSLKKPPRSLREELLTYQHLEKEARENGNQKLADRWNLAAQLIMGFVRYLHSSRDSSFLTELLERATINDRTIEIQEIAEYTTTSLAALRNHNPILAKKLMHYAEETKEAGVRYRHWLAFIKQEIATHHTQEPSLDKIAAQYRTNAFKATQTDQKEIAQHWAEAACLAQETCRKKGLSLSSYVVSGNEILSMYWELSKEASYEATKLKAKVALALEQGDKISAQEYDCLALVAEKLSSYRENLVRCIMNGEMSMIFYWKNAAEFLNKSLEMRRALAKFPKDDPSLSYHKIIIEAAEQVAESYYTFIFQLQKKKKTSLIRIFNHSRDEQISGLTLVHLAEQIYEEARQALQFFQEGNLPAAIITKKRLALFHDVYQFSYKATQAKTKWYTLGIPFLYWTYHIKNVEKSLTRLNMGMNLKEKN